MSLSIDHNGPVAESTYRRTTPTLIKVIGRAIWRALERAGQLRAQRALRAAAARYEPFDPALARRLRDASLFDFERETKDAP